MNNLKEIIKAVLFIAGDGVEVDTIMEKLEIDKKTLNKAVEEIKKDYDENSGIQLIEYKNKIQLCSNPSYAEQISTVLNPIREKALTKAALETVAIIAYKQPITKLEIEEIRKINSADYAIQVLLDNKLIEIVGRKDAVGKPYLFGTTDEFLKRFNLKDNNVTKSAIAAQLNVTPIMITHYLHGGVAMRTENLIILAKLMNTTVDDLLKTEEV